MYPSFVSECKTPSNGNFQEDQVKDQQLFKPPPLI